MGAINEESLPKPLSNEEFVYYYNQFKNGSVGAGNILIYHNIRIVYWYIKNHIRYDLYEFDDILSLGLEALIDAIYHYDINKGEVSTCIITYVKNKVLKYFRDDKKHKNVMSLDGMISDSYNSDNYIDTVRDEIYLEEDMIDKEYLKYIRNMVYDEYEFMDKIDRCIIDMYFGFGNIGVYGQVEIAKELGISQSYVSKRINRLLNRFRDKLLIDDCIKIRKRVA